MGQVTTPSSLLLCLLPKPDMRWDTEWASAQTQQLSKIMSLLGFYSGQLQTTVLPSVRTRQRAGGWLVAIMYTFIDFVGILERIVGDELRGHGRLPAWTTLALHTFTLPQG